MRSNCKLYHKDLNIYGLKLLQQVGLGVDMRKNFPLNFLLSIVMGSFSSYEK